MQSFELLGGKYQQGEQILPGVIQTFRSYEVPTGRPVFIHRIPLADPAAKEVADLLSAGLIRSPAVRKMLVDVYERGPYQFVVTESSRQCVPLRDWLEREADVAPESAPAVADYAVPEASVAEAAAEQDAAAPNVSSEDEVEATAPEPETESSEFARLFHEALSGKLERSRRNAAAQQNVAAVKSSSTESAAPQESPERGPRLRATPAPAEEKASTPVEPRPAVTHQSPAPDLLFQAVEQENAGRSRLVIILVVVAVLALLIVMSIVFFVAR